MNKRATHQSIIDLYNSISGGTMGRQSGTVRTEQPDRIEAHVHNGDKHHELAQNLRSKLAAKLDQGEMTQLTGNKNTEVTDSDTKPGQLKTIKTTTTDAGERVEKDRMAAQQQVPVSPSLLTTKAAALKLRLKLAGCGSDHGDSKKKKKKKKEYAAAKDVPMKAVKVAAALALIQTQSQ